MPYSFLKMKTLIFIATLAGGLMSPTAQAQEVYNFYFQKAEATVKSESPPTPTPSPELNSTTVMPVFAIKAPLLHWQLNASYGTFTDRQKTAQGFSIGGGYAFNKYLGLETQLMSGKARTNFTSMENDNSSYYAGSAGVRLTPIHIELLGWNLIEISVLGGLLTNRDDSLSERITPYLGFGISFNFSHQVSALIQYRFADADTEFGQSNIGFGMNF